MTRRGQTLRDWHRITITNLRRSAHVRACRCCQDDLDCAAEDAGHTWTTKLLQMITERAKPRAGGPPS